MDENKEYLMPDYYPDFRCKMGDCRSSCCEGWRVSLSENEYFRLLGMECPPEIRRRLDCAMHLSEGAGEERYAEMSHDYTGNCKMRMEDGRCLIQAEMGEDSMPLICKLYPRAYRSEGKPECSCAASCEKVIEMLFFRKEPLRFIKGSPEFDVPAPPSPTIYSEKIPEEQALRLFLIGIVQDRSVPLGIRLYRLGEAMRMIQSDIDGERRPCAEEILAYISSLKPDITKEYITEHLPVGLDMIKKMMKVMEKHGAALNRYGEKILDHFSDGDTLGKYCAARKKFDAVFPSHEEGFENLLVNHMFFTRFPFADDSRSELDEYLAIGMVYTSLRFLAVGWTATHDSEEDLVDIFAAAFRLMEHTPFHPFAASLLHREHCDTPEELSALMSL